MFPMPLVMVCSVASWLRMYASSEYLFFREEFLSFSRARSQKNKRKGERGRGGNQLASMYVEISRAYKSSMTLELAHIVCIALTYNTSHNYCRTLNEYIFTQSIWNCGCNRFSGSIISLVVFGCCGV